MKNLIIFEYFTAYPTDYKNINKSVLSEGINMINKLADILSKNKINTKVYVLRNKKLQTLNKKNIYYLFTDKEKDWLKIIQRFDKKKTKIILIAPEFDNLLYQTAKRIYEFGFELLNSDLKSLQIFSSKLETSKYLRLRKIPYIENLKFEECISNNRNNNKTLVLKPSLSAGSEKIFIVKDKFSLVEIDKKINYSYIIQKYYKNHLGSFSMLCKNGNNILLTCNKHIIKIEKNEIKQIGSEFGKYENFRNEFQKLADQISNNFKGLYGFIGIDVVRDNKVWKILEINTRLTSSFVHTNKSYSYDLYKVIKMFYLRDILKSEFIPRLVNIKKVIF